MPSVAMAVAATARVGSLTSAEEDNDDDEVREDGVGVRVKAVDSPPIVEEVDDELSPALSSSSSSR